MRSIRGFVLIVLLVLVAHVFVSIPSFARQDEAAALSARVTELYRAGKYSEAIPLAQRALAILEKTRGPNHLDVARALNNLAAVYQCMSSEHFGPGSGNLREYLAHLV